MKKFTFLLLFLLTLSAGYGQLVANYTFSQSTGNAYTEITGGTVVTSCTNCATAYDSNQYVITLPSSFSYNFAAVSSVAMRVDGSLVLGVTTVPTNSVSPISSTITAPGVISALGMDLRDSQMTGMLYELRWQEVGDEFVFQWKNAARWGQGAAERLNFQIRIHKTTGAINIAYGDMVTIANSTTYQPQVGLRGAAATDYNARNLTTTVPTATPSWENTALATSNGATVRFTSGAPAAFPTSGLTFTYTPPAPCTGAPVAGTVSTVMNRFVCNGIAPGVITVTGANASVPGISYQWQESIDGGTTWANATAGTGATTTSYTPPVFAGTAIQYRLKVSCAGGSDSFTDVTTVSPQAAPATSATALAATALPTTGVITWTNGNGGRRFVLLSTTPIVDPVYGLATPTFTAAAAFANAGQQMVYEGTGSSVTVTGLACNTTYYIKVYEYNRCGSASPYDVYVNTAGATAITFTTGVTTAPGLPVTNNFTGYTGTNLHTAMPGWYEASITTAGGTAPSSANPVGILSTSAAGWTSATALGTTTARVNLFTNTVNAWLISPKMAITANSRLKFKAAITDYSSAAAGTANADAARMQGTDDKVLVLVSTDGCGATWTPVYTFNAANTTTLTNQLTDFTVALNDYVGQTIQVAFQAIDGPLDELPDYEFHVGNILIEQVPACDIPVVLAASAVTKNSATIAWNLPSGTPTGYQYVVSASNTAPTGAGTPTTALTANVSGLPASTMHYVFVRTVCGSDFSDWSLASSFTTLCEYPDILTSNATALCGQGTSTLTATSSGGTISWYAAQTGGIPLSSGSQFVTPLLDATTSYWVGATASGGSGTAGKTAPPATATGSPFTNWGIVFNATEEVTLTGVTVFTTTAGTLDIKIMNAAMTTELYSTGNISIPAGGTTTPFVVPLNYTVAPGTGYRMVIKAYSGVNLIRDSDALAFPYNGTDGAINVTSSEWGGTTTGTYYYFYNLQYASGCSSPRTQVTVNITDAPAIVATTTDNEICAGESTGLAVTSANAGYAYVWMPGNLTGAIQTVTPSATTTYTVTATDTVSGCVETATVTVTVNALPVVPAMNDVTVCEGGIQALTYTGPAGTVTSGTGTGTTSLSVTTAALGPNPLQNFYGGAKQQWIYTASELTALGMAAGSNINSIGLNLATSGTEVLNGMVIKMKNTTASSFASTTAWVADLVTVKTSFNHTPSTGINTFALTTPFVWDGTSNLVIQMSYSNNDSPAAAEATNTAKYSATSFVSTIYYRVDSVTPATIENYTGTASYTYSQRNDVTFSFGTPTQTVWTPVTNLYTDAAATVPYTGTTAGTVYTKPVANVTYTATASNAAGCSVSDQVAVTVSIIAAPTVAEPAQTFCGGATVANLQATGTGLKWYAASTGGTALAATTVLADATTYYASQTVNGCESVARTAVAVTVNTVAAPTVAEATPTFCNSATVAGLQATGTAIKWYDEATGGTALEATTALTNGGTYYASQTVAGCESAVRTLVTVTINAPAAPTATATQTVCNSGTVADLTATGTAGATIAWYSAATGGTALAATTALTNGGVYYASQTVTGCESATRTMVTVTINAPAAPTVTVTQTVCNSGTVADLTATGNAGATIVWYSAATGGTALATTTALTNGGVYYASQTVTGCESATRAMVTVTVNAPAAPTATATQTVCNLGTVADLTATGTAGATITWYSAATGGTALAATTALTNGGVYYASQTVTGCESMDRAMVTITVNAPAAPTATAAQVFCDAATVSGLSATGNAGATITWYSAETGGTALASTTALTNGGVYYASQTVTGCESETRAMVTVTIATVAAPVVTVLQPTCAVATGSVTVTAPVGAEYTYSVDGTTFQASATFNGLVAGTYTVTAKNTADCTATSSVTINAAPEVPAAPTATLTQPTCTVATGTIEVTAPIADANTYSIDGTTFGPSSIFENVAPGTYTVTVKNSAGCTSTASVTINAAPVGPNAPGGATTQVITASVAADATIEDIVVEVEAGSTVTWYATAEDAEDGTDALDAGTQLVTGTTYYGTQTVGECESAYIAVTVEVVLGKEDFGRNAFSAYPNPVKDVLNISYTAEITSVTVFNLLGQQVISKQPNATEVKLDLSALADATYIVNVTAGNTVKTIKVVKKQ